MFEDINDKDEPINSIEDKNNLMSSSIKTMYIDKNRLIEVQVTTHYDDDVYANSDTTGYGFYDFDKQIYAIFNSFSPGSEPTHVGLIDSTANFFRSPQQDYFNNTSVSILRIIDTVVDNRELKLVRFNTQNSNLAKFESLAKVWVDPKVKNFPLQVSYALSEKMDNAFAYKIQLPMSDLKHVAVMSYDYKPAALPDSIKAIFQSWSKKVNSHQEKLKK